MQPYESYKETGIEWIGKIPEHWKIERLGDISIVNSTSLPVNTAENYKLRYIDISNVNYNGIISFDNIEELTFEEAPSRARRMLKNNDIIISTVRPNLQAVAYINFDDKNLICSTGFNVVSPRNQSLESKFLYYFLVSEISKQYFTACATGVGYPSISDYPFRSIQVPFAPISEQIAIAKYLDEATENIDKTIKIKENQLKKLESYKKSKIHETVTKGLEPNPKLKPSGIQWIGDIPQHWKVERLKFVLTKIGSGVTPKGGSTVYQETGIPLIRSQNVYDDGFYFDEIAFISEKIHEEMKGSKVLFGDVLLNITGASIGRSFPYLRTEEANVNQHVCILRPNEKINTAFLHFLTISEVIQSQISSGFKGSGREGLNFETIKNFAISLPKKQEQKAIAEYLDKLCKNTENVKQNIEKQLIQLKKCRKSLIHECVTGKRKIA